MQHRFAAHNEDAAESLRIRIGIDAGEPVVNNGDLFGTTVQLAHRLCAEAEADGVLVSGVVRELAGADGPHFVAIGERRLKGFARRVPVYRFEWRAWERAG
jgi:class 3 adenylate cyclase